MGHDDRVGNSPEDDLEDSPDDSADDLLIDFQDVTLVRDGCTLVGPVTWQVELDERWVVIGPNGRARPRYCVSPRQWSSPHQARRRCWGAARSG